MEKARFKIVQRGIKLELFEAYNVDNSFSREKKYFEMMKDSNLSVGEICIILKEIAEHYDNTKCMVDSGLIRTLIKRLKEFGNDEIVKLITPKNQTASDIAKYIEGKEIIEMKPLESILENNGIILAVGKFKHDFIISKTHSNGLKYNILIHRDTEKNPRVFLYENEVIGLTYGSIPECHVMEIEPIYLSGKCLKHNKETEYELWSINDYTDESKFTIKYIRFNKMKPEHIEKIKELYLKQ